MNDQNLIDALQQIKIIVDHCLNAPKTRKRPSNERKRTAAQASAPRDSLPDHVITLRGHGFFNAPKTYNEVHAELQQTYHCDPDRVRVALIRLHDRKQLRKTSKSINGKKQNAYVW